MHDDYFAFAAKASEKVINSAANVGHINALMRCSPRHRSYPLSYLHQVLEVALVHGFFKLYFNRKGEPVGYVVWAFLAPDAEQRFLKNGTWELHDSEWSEGDSLWIVDLLAPFGHIEAIMRDLRDNIFPDQRRLRYFRIKNDRAVSKEISRDSVCAFFKASRSAPIAAVAAPADLIAIDD